jgi:hypothetical protein
MMRSGRDGMRNIQTNGGNNDRSDTISISSSSNDGRLSLDYEHTEQRSHKEVIVVTLSQQYALGQDSLYRIKPLLTSSKLLALLEAKNKADNKWLDLQAGSFVSVQLLEQMCCRTR